MTTPNAKKFIADLQEAYAPAVEELSRKLPGEESSFMAQWGYLLNQLAIPSSDTSKLAALSAFMPLVSAMDDLSGDEFKDLFSMVFLSFINSLSKD